MPLDWTENWEGLKQDFPIDLSNLIKYCEEFESLVRMDLKNVQLAKEKLIKARGRLCLAINSLYSEFYDREIFKEKEDIIIFYWLKDDLNRVLLNLEKAENSLLIEEDSKDETKDNVNISRVTSFFISLTTIEEGIIFNSLKKAKKEYNLVKDKNKNKRTFLYILFLIISNSVGMFGGLAKEEGKSKRGAIGSFPMSYQSLMGKHGKEIINESYGGEEDLDSLMKAFEEGDEDEDDSEN